MASSLGCASTPPSRPKERQTHLVATDRGPLLGIERSGARAYLGIPYAAPPVGARRWKAPADVEPWATPRDASRRGPACAQLDTSDAPREASEDCLTLNVWVPPNEGPALPVLAWIHGGAFYQGSGGDPLYDGAALAARARAIVVTLNYRLGPLGFLSHRGLERRAGAATSPSFGLLDQQAALRWVQRNIAAFGGDASRVTLFGESAGAWSVCSHLAMPSSRGLFARAIMQSGACANALYFSARAAEAQGDQLAEALHCRDVACLRGKDAGALVAALPMKRGLILAPGIWWGPVVDGDVLPRLPFEALRDGTSIPVPLIVGWNRDEGILHTVSFDEVTPSEVEGFVRDTFGPAAAAAVPAAYPRPTPKDALTDIVTDGVFACDARRVGRALAARGLPVFLYELQHALDDPRAHDLGATHSVDLFFLFGNQDKGFGLSERERALAGTFMDAWGRFAATGAPGAAALPWPAYTLEHPALMRLDLHSEVAPLQRAQCDRWDALVGR